MIKTNYYYTIYYTLGKRVITTSWMEGTRLDRDARLLQISEINILLSIVSTACYTIIS